MTIEDLEPVLVAWCKRNGVRRRKTYHAAATRWDLWDGSTRGRVEFYWFREDTVTYERTIRIRIHSLEFLIELLDREFSRPS